MKDIKLKVLEDNVIIKRHIIEIIIKYYYKLL